MQRNINEVSFQIQGRYEGSGEKFAYGGKLKPEVGSRISDL